MHIFIRLSAVFGIIFNFTTTLYAQDVKVGIILGFTGPIESITPSIARSAELAFKEASTSGNFLGGVNILSVRGDSTCVDAAAATSTAERLITIDRVAAIIGADCSGVTTAIANNVAVPNGVVMVSPSATSSALSLMEDQGLFFRTAPSDSRQGEVLSKIAWQRGIREIAITYTNNDYGKGLSDSFSAAFIKKGGVVSIATAHEDGRGDYSSEVAALSASGASILAVFGYSDQGGLRMVQTSVDTGAFETFLLGDGMFSQNLIDAIGVDLEGSFITTSGNESDGMAKFIKNAAEDGFSGDGPFNGASYDAAALIVLATQAAGSSNREAIKSNILNVANAPGEKIEVGDLPRALKILSEGGEIDYVGATDIELNDNGEAFGSYRELEIKEGKFQLVNVH